MAMGMGGPISHPWGGMPSRIALASPASDHRATRLAGVMFGAMAVIAVAAALLPLPAFGADEVFASPPRDEVKSRALDWAAAQKIADADALDRIGKLWAELPAETSAWQMFERVIETFRIGDVDSRRLMGTLHTLHALGLAGTGDLRGAKWHWTFAQSLSLALAKSSLAPFGDAGRSLEPWRLVSGSLEDGCRLAEHAAAATAGDLAPVNVEGEVQPPVKPDAPFPVYPRAIRDAGVEDQLVIQTIILEDGSVDGICVLKSRIPALAHQAAQALETWTFEPATIDGEPVAAYFNLTVDFKLR